MPPQRDPDGVPAPNHRRRRHFGPPARCLPLPPPARAYLSVIPGPDSASEDARTEAVARATGVDPFQARQAVRKGAPQVIASLPPEAARTAVEALRAIGAVAM